MLNFPCEKKKMTLVIKIHFKGVRYACDVFYSCSFRGVEGLKNSRVQFI